MKKYMLKLLPLLLLTPGLGMSYSFAQAGAKGGGRIMESDLRSYMLKLDQFLDSDEGMKTFPEIVKYDRTHPDFPFHEILLATRPVVQEGEVLDQFGVARDCVSFDDAKGRRFVCQLNKLPEASLQNQPRVYRLVMHELLVQAGIELPVSETIPSQYAISTRMMENVHLVTYQEWIPGKLNCDGYYSNISINMPNPLAAGFETGNVAIAPLNEGSGAFFETDDAHYDSIHYITDSGIGHVWTTRVPDDAITYRVVKNGPSLLERLKLTFADLSDELKGKQVQQWQDYGKSYIPIGITDCIWTAPSSTEKYYKMKNKCAVAVRRSIRKTQFILDQLSQSLTKEQTKTVKCFQTKMREGLSAMDQAKRVNRE